MTQVTVNGNTYSDDGSTAKDMLSGGFRTNLVPMISDAVVVVGNAASSAAAAAASAASAVSSAATNATSTTTLTIATGTQSLTIQTAKSIVVGMQLVIASTASPTNWMAGSVTSYNSGTGALVVSVSNINGSATGVSAWTVSLTGAPGVTGVLHELKGASIAAASTVNLDSATGNFVHITGNGTINNFTLAAGECRTVVFDGTPILAHSLAATVLPGAANIQVAAGDSMMLRGEGGGVVKCVDFSRANGLPVVALGNGGTTTTGTINLLPSSPAVQVVTPFAPGLSMLLGDATTFNKGIVASVFNAGDYDYGVKNFAGTQLGWIRPGTDSIIGLADNSTSAGVWACSNIEKIGFTAQYANPTLTGTSAKIIRVVLDANRTCFLFGGTSVYAVIYDASILTWGSAILVRSGLNSQSFAALSPATNIVMVVSSDSPGNMEAVTLTSSGTTLTLNSGTKGTAALAGSFGSMGQLIAVGTSFVVNYTRSASVNTVRAITVSGTTPTIGAEVLLSGTSALANIYAASSTVLMTISYTSASTIYALPITVSGSTLTAGTVATTVITTGGFRSIATAAGRWAIAYVNTTTYAGLISLSGTTASISAVNMGTAAGNGATNIEMALVSATKICCAYMSGGTGSIYFNILTDTTGTASVGSELAISVSNNPQSAIAVNVAGSVVNFAFSTPAASYSMNIDASGTSPTQASTIAAYGSPNATLTGSDVFNVRSWRTLLVNAIAYFFSSTTTYAARTSRVTPTIISSLNPVNILTPSFSSGTPGANTNESWTVDTVNSGATGIYISRVEAAA